MCICPCCNTELTSEGKFCPKCGIPVVLADTAGVHDNASANTNARKKKRNRLFFLIAIVAAALVVFGFVAYHTLLPFSKNPAAIKKAVSSVVKIYCYDYEGEESATGSGFLAYDDKTVITNYHVLEHAYTCKVSTEQDKVFAVESILAYSRKNDIAILKLSQSTGLQPLKFGDSSAIQQGEPVIAIGSPLGIKNTVSQGVFSGRTKEKAREVLCFTAAISSGSSGGALFDDKGAVIGITSASYTEGQNLNLAIPIEFAIDLFNERGEEQAVSTIYLTKYPYVQYLGDYTDAIDVTIEQLKTDPYKYDGKTVRIRSFVSCLQDGLLQYVSDYEYVSGNYDSDSSYDFNVDFGMHPYLDVSNASSRKYEAFDIVPGDPVVIIGQFVYCEKGERLLGDRKFYQKVDLAELYADIIYKDD